MVLILLLQGTDGPKEACLNCHQLFDLCTLPEHLKSCQGSTSSNSASTSQHSSSIQSPYFSQHTGASSSSPSGSSNQCPSSNRWYDNLIDDDDFDDDLEDFEPLRRHYRNPLSQGLPSENHPRRNEVSFKFYDAYGYVAHCSKYSMEVIARGGFSRSLIWHEVASASCHIEPQDLPPSTIMYEHIQCINWLLV